MDYREEDKELLAKNGAIILSNIIVYDADGNGVGIYTEDNHVAEWTYEDYRYVPDTGFIGQFVERILDGKLVNIPADVSLEGKEISLQIGIENMETFNTQYYDYGRFIITEVGREDTTGDYTFQSCDYTKKFNTIFENNLSYPCLALDLVNAACKQVDVGLYNDTDSLALCYAVPKDGLLAGDYSFKVLKDSEGDEEIYEYYDFTLDSDLKYRDSLMLVFNEDRLTLKTIDENYVVHREDIEYTPVDSTTNNILVPTEVNYCEFTNNDFVIGDNQFDEDETCRDVVKAIAQLGYTWARIGLDNKLHLDFNKKDEHKVSKYDIISTEQYYEAKKTGLTIQPVNKVLIGLKDVDGENQYSTSKDYKEESESVIQIWDNPLTYTEELRKIALNGCEKLFGLTYTPMTVESIGHPWLEGDELVKLTNLSEEDLYFYPFDRKIVYQGYIKTTLSAQAEDPIDLKYEYDSAVINRLTHTEISVDKANDRITAMSSLVDGAVNKATEVEQNFEGITSRVSQVETDIDGEGGLKSQLVEVKQRIDSITNLFESTGGNNIIRNSALLLNDNVWDFEILPDVVSYHTTLGESYNGSLAGVITSMAEIKLQNCTMSSSIEEKDEQGNITKSQNIIIPVTDTDYTFSYIYSQDEDVVTNIKLIDLETNQPIDLTEVISSEETVVKQVDRLDTIANRVSKKYTIRPLNPYLKLEIETTSVYDNRYFYIYDMMLNQGDNTSWEPSQGEIHSTIIKLSRQGLQVISTGKGTATSITADGFAVKKISGSGDNITIGDVITEFDDTGIITKDIKGDSLSTGKFVSTEMRLDGTEHHVEYFKE